MAIYKNISSKYVIAKIYRDLGLDDSNYIYDFIEWFGEALDFIGSSSQFVLQNEDLVVADYKAPIPSNFVSLKQLQYNNPENDCWELIEYNPSNFFEIEDNCPNKNVVTEESFSLNPNYILTSFETGDIKISYKSFPTDEEGFPLVPDNQYFKEALFWYCYKKMLLRGHAPRSQEMSYEYADHKWKFYCSGARNKANYPDISGYQRFREIWVGLLPSTIDETGFDSKVERGIPLETIQASNLVTNPMKIENNE